MIHSIINCNHWGSNPILWRNAWIKAHSTLSHDLFMSVLIAINFFWHDLLVLRPWNISWAKRILSEIKRPTTKPVGVFQIRVGRQLFNLWHNTLDIILYPTLQRLIDHNFVNRVGLYLWYQAGICWVQSDIKFSRSKRNIHQIKKVLFNEGQKYWKK